MKRVMPPSASASNTSDASFSPDWGHATIWLSIITAHGRVVIVPRAKLFSPLTALTGGNSSALGAGDSESLGEGDAVGAASLGAGDAVGSVLGAAAIAGGDGASLGDGSLGASLGAADADGSALGGADGVALGEVDGASVFVGETTVVADNSGVAVSGSNVAVASPGCVIGTNTNAAVGVVVAALASGELVISACAVVVGAFATIEGDANSGVRASCCCGATRHAASTNAASNTGKKRTRSMRFPLCVADVIPHCSGLVAAALLMPR
jgi:hypothetical protein